MKGWIFWNLEPGTELPEHEGVRPGDEVAIRGWRNELSVDMRRVVRITRERCEGGAMLHLDRPLQNGSQAVSAGWARALSA